MGEPFPYMIAADEDLVTLLRFFTLSIEEQDDILPECFVPIWIRVSHFDRAVDTPRLMIALILRHLIGNRTSERGQQGIHESSSVALCLLLDMLFEIDAGTLFVRLRPQEGVLSYVRSCWELVAVLSQDVLNTFSSSPSEVGRFDFAHLSEKYRDPAGDEAARMAYPVKTG